MYQLLLTQNILSNSIENRLHKIEDKIMGMQLSKLPENNLTGEISKSDNFCVDILKNRILELEKQLSEKNSIIDFLTTQLIGKSHDVSNKFTDNNSKNNKANVSPVSTIEEKEKGIEDQLNKVVIIGDSMLNNISSRGLCKSKEKEVDVLNYPGATSADILNKIDDVLNEKPASLIVHVGTNDLTKDINLLSNAKKIVNKINKASPNTVLTFSNIIVRKDKKKLEKDRADTNVVKVI